MRKLEQVIQNRIADIIRSIPQTSAHELIHEPIHLNRAEAQRHRRPIIARTRAHTREPFPARGAPSAVFA